MSITVKAGSVSLADWQRIYRGETPVLDPASHPKITASAESVARILARHEPVYGINTGFGKLASVKISDDDLLTLQRNIVLSHAAGVGEPTPTPIARLMMALKLASLAQGASGVQLTTVGMLGALLEKGLTPVIPAQGSVGASGDLAPLAHMAAAMIGTGEIWVGDVCTPALQALADAGLSPITLGPKEGLALLNGQAPPKELSGGRGGVAFGVRACLQSVRFAAAPAFQRSASAGAVGTPACFSFPPRSLSVPEFCHA